MLSIINRPFFNDFMELAADSKSSIKLCAPFIKKDIVDELYSVKKSTSKVEVLTNINLASFHRKASDVSAFKTILTYKHCVTNCPRLHAKFYIFDDKKLIITSANLTSSGLKHNLEYGIYTDEAELVQSAAKDYRAFCSDELAGEVTLNHTQEILTLLAALVPLKEKQLPPLKLDYSTEDDLLSEHEIPFISNKLNGWTKSVFEELSKLNQQVFTTGDFYKFAPDLKIKYPNNQNVDAKIRQQLQFLRDIGLIKFVKPGTYKKLWR